MEMHEGGEMSHRRLGRRSLGRGSAGGDAVGREVDGRPGRSGATGFSADGGNRARGRDLAAGGVGWPAGVTALCRSGGAVRA
jgi:hypothetical protein